MKMEKYSLLCILLFTMIIGSQTVPHNTDKRSSKDSMQKDPGAGNMGHDIGEIMFPDEMPQTRTPSRKDFSAEGKGIDCVEGVCEQAKDYPSEYIAAIVKQLHGSLDLNGEYIGNYIDNMRRIKPGDPEQEELCASQVYTTYPKSIKNDRNISKYIVNDDKYKQGVIYETCLKRAECNKIASFPEEIQATCVQKYSQVRLLAVEMGSTGTPKGHDIGEIMFPDEMPQTRTHARKDFSAEGKGIDCIEGVCLGAQDYPSQDIIEAVVKKLHGSVDLNGEYIGKYFDSKMRIKPGDPEQEELCASQVYTEYPKSIKNDQNMSKYIINAGNHKQGIIYETCVNGADCKKDASFPEGYTTTCVQKYSKIRLWAIDTDSAGTPEPAFDSFIVPSCCVCAFTKTKV